MNNKTNVWNVCMGKDWREVLDIIDNENTARVHNEILLRDKIYELWNLQVNGSRDIHPGWGNTDWKRQIFPLFS